MDASTTSQDSYQSAIARMKRRQKISQRSSRGELCFNSETARKQNGIFVKQQSNVQLPPKKRKISCDFLVKDVIHADNGRSDEMNQNGHKNGINTCNSITHRAVVVEEEVVIHSSVLKGNSANEMRNKEARGDQEVRLGKRRSSCSNEKTSVATSVRKKQQQKYVPDRPMSAEEMKAWRKEARRIRNRQSAAASRQKTKDRIAILESEVQSWRTKYEGVMEKIRSIEASTKISCEAN